MYSSLKTSSILQGFPKYRSNLVGNAAFMPGGFEAIATVTASGGETSLTFSSIPQGYASLQIRGITRDTYASTGIRSLMWRLNSDTGNNYARHQLYGDGSSAYAGGTASTSFMNAWSCAPGNNNTAGLFGAVIFDLHDYASTSRNKTARMFSGADLNGSGSVNLTSGVWISTAAVTTVTVIAEATAFAAGSTFALYGIKGAA